MCDRGQCRAVAKNDNNNRATTMPLTLLRMTTRIERLARRRSRRASRPFVEGLEERTALTGAAAPIGLDHAPLAHLPTAHDVSAISRRFPIGTISGTVVNSTTGRGLGRIRVQLIDAQGDVVGVRATNARGRYAFPIWQNGPYVVHEVTPRRFTQTSPTVNLTPLTGSFAINPKTGKPYGSTSWTNTGGNSDAANGPVGPYAWDAVAPSGHLPFQSPINFDVPPTNLAPYLQIHYANSTPTDIANNGHELLVEFPANNPSTSINVGGTVFHLAQFHFHDPSEHTVDGKGYSMELHFVNVSKSGAAAVVGVFLQLGAHNSALQPILDAAQSSLMTPGSTTPGAAPINFAGLLPSNMTGWFYQGSLTAPPLSQTVNWFVLATPITLDGAQLKQYEAIASAAGFLPNNRPVQPLEGRKVNQFNYQVNFDNQSISGLTFTIARSTPVRLGHAAQPAGPFHSA